MVDVILSKFQTWKSSGSVLSFEEWKKENKLDEEDIEPKASAPVTPATITNAPRNITPTNERKNKTVRSKITLSLLRKLEDYYIPRNLTMSSAVYEILKDYFNKDKGGYT